MPSLARTPRSAITQRVVLTSSNEGCLGYRLNLPAGGRIRLNGEAEFTLVDQTGDGLLVVPYRTNRMRWVMVPPRSVRNRATLVPWDSVHEIHLY